MIEVHTHSLSFLLVFFQCLEDNFGGHQPYLGWLEEFEKQVVPDDDYIGLARSSTGRYFFSVMILRKRLWKHLLSHLVYELAVERRILDFS
jgi:hypothetical protein